MKEDNNELENLYKKAAADFPLNTDSANWQTVLKQLEREENKKPFWFNKRNAALVLLLLAFAIGSTMFYSHFKNNASNLSTSKTTEKQLAEQKKRELDITNAVYKKIIDSINEEKNNVENKNNVAINNQKNSVKLLIDKTTNEIHHNRKVVGETPITKANNNSLLSFNPQKEISISNNNVKKLVGETPTSRAKSKLTKQLLFNNNSKTIQNSNNNLAITNTKNSVSKNINSLLPFNPKKENSVANNDVKKLVSETPNNTIKDTTTKPSDTVPNSIKIAITKQNKQQHKGFYLGLVTGTQINHIDGQAINKLGIDVGATIGYRLNKNISFETGLFYSQKHYYTSGEHFSMAKVANTMPANMQLISVNGTSNIVEIPITIKYDFILKNKSNYFATAGLSSYILTKESNDYLALVNGVKQNLQGSYTNGSNYFNATINLSVGYEHKFFKKYTFKIEPYIQIPIKQMGVGSMPISSAGVHFGVYFPLH